MIIRPMDQYSFAVEVTGAITQNPHYEDVIYESGCDDGLIVITNGKMVIDFDRSAPSYDPAVASAIRDLQRIGVEIVKISPITD